jgi:hypothetical protein
VERSKTRHPLMTRILPVVLHADPRACGVVGLGTGCIAVLIVLHSVVVSFKDTVDMLVLLVVCAFVLLSVTDTIMKMSAQCLAIL